MCELEVVGVFRSEEWVAFLVGEFVYSIFKWIEVLVAWAIDASAVVEVEGVVCGCLEG